MKNKKEKTKLTIESANPPNKKKQKDMIERIEKFLQETYYS